MAFDPTTITSAVIATPISMLGNTIKTWITNWWHLEEYVEEGRRDHRMYTPVLQNVVDPVLERQLELLDHQLADSDQSVGCLGFFKSSIRAQGIQDSRTRLRDSFLSYGMVSLMSRSSDRQPAVHEHILYRYNIPDVYLETSDYAVGIENRIQRLESLLLDETGPQLIGIFGMAGVGKSSLAALVCRRERVKQHFRDKIFWVDVSNVGCHSEVLQLQMELFSAFTGHPLIRSFASEVEGRQALCNYLAAQQERYLLVYDNVWKRRIVDPLHFELNSSDRRTNTKTLVVSRKGDLLQGSRFQWSSEEVQPLSSKDVYRLFCKHAFRGNETVPEDVEGYVQTLVDRCSGIPMVVEVMAKYVSRDEQRMEQVGFWKYILSEVGRAEAESDDDYQKLLEMMKLSYEDMKKDVKQLFLLYATMRHYFLYDDLYHKWLALQGAVEEDEVMRIKFERVFDALQTGFLVGVKRHYERHHERHDGLPPLLIDLAHNIMAADKSLGFFANRCPQSEEELESAELINISSRFKCFGGRIEGLQSATHLKVLDHDEFYNFNQSDFPSSLRFLSIYMSNVEDSLSRLVDLRFLRLGKLGGDGMERALMAALRKLTKLEVLQLSFEVKVELDLSFLGCMPGLIFLHIAAPRESTVRNIHHMQLKRLKRLYIPITCTNLENRDWEHGNTGLEFFQIGSKLEGTSTDAEVDRLLGPCSKLVRLCLEHIRITKLPSEFNFPNLTSLELTVAMEHFGCSSISVPKLENLKLDGCGLLSEMPFTSCPALKELKLRGLPGLVQIGDELNQGISGMDISHCEKLEKLRLPGSIESLWLKGLPSLVQVGYGARLPSSRWQMGIIDCEKLHILPRHLNKVWDLHLEALPSLTEFATASRLGELKRLTIINCERLAALVLRMSSPGVLRCLTLEVLDLINFGWPVGFPKLQDLHITKCKLPTLDQIIGVFPSLYELQISGCEHSVNVEPLQVEVEGLSLNLEALLSLGQAVSFPRLTVLRLHENLPASPAGKCYDLLLSYPGSYQECAPVHGLEIPGPGVQLQLMMEIEQCKRLARLSVGQLWALDLWDLPSLVEIDLLPSTLKKLDIYKCGSLRTVPSAPGLKWLQLVNLPSLVEIGPEYPSLKALKISECERLDLNVLSAPKLKTLQLKRLPSLVEVGGPDFASLRHLSIVDCESLSMLPCAPKLHFLQVSGVPSFDWRRDFPHLPVIHSGYPYSRTDCRVCGGRVD